MRLFWDHSCFGCCGWDTRKKSEAGVTWGWGWSKLEGTRIYMLCFLWLWNSTLDCVCEIRMKLETLGSANPSRTKKSEEGTGVRSRSIVFRAVEFRRELRSPRDDWKVLSGTSTSWFKTNLQPYPLWWCIGWGNASAIFDELALMRDEISDHLSQSVKTFSKRVEIRDSPYSGTHFDPTCRWEDGFGPTRHH